MSTIRVLQPNNTVTEMPLEEYLRGVVPHELLPAWRTDSALHELRKAQTVAARTYSRFAMAQPRHQSQGADVCTTTHCQVWKAAAFPATDNAIADTAGVIIWHRGKPINAVYSARCGGRTRSGRAAWNIDVPYWQPVDCPDQGSPNGHGVGMCQYGAKSLAEQGQTYDVILQHYYTGVTVGKDGPMTTKRLVIPWVSQLGPGADNASADCGIACLTQLARAFVRATTTVDELCHLAGLGPQQNAHIKDHVQKTATKLGIELQYRNRLTVADIENALLDDRGVILLVYYPKLVKRYDLNYTQGHYITVHGMEGVDFFYDDPYWRSKRDGEDIRIAKTTLLVAANYTGAHFSTPGQGLVLRSHRLPDWAPSRPAAQPPAPAPAPAMGPPPGMVTVDLPVPDGATKEELWWFGDEWARVVRDVYGRDDVHNYLVQHLRPALLRIRDAA